MVIVKDQSFHLVYLNICINKQTCDNLSSIGRRICEIVHEVVCFQMLDFETLKSNFEVPESNSGKITPFFMCYTISSSPLLVTKKSVMLIIILSNYQ